MILYHCPGARSSRCLWTMHELGIADRVELITLSFPPRVTCPDYLKQNVLGTIPYFVDGDVRMTESVAICVYLASRFPDAGPDAGGGLAIRPDEPDYGAYLNWLYHADATLTFPQTVVLRYTLQEPGVADAAAKGYARWFIARLRLLSQTLADGRPFLCGGRFTLADICITYALFFGTTLQSEGRTLSEFYKPHVREYMERMLRRKAWADANQHTERSAAAFKDGGSKL